MRSLGQDLGYLAIAPDLFWRINEGTDLDPDVEAEFNEALDLMGKFDQDQGIRDIEATIHYAQNAPLAIIMSAVSAIASAGASPS